MESHSVTCHPAEVTFPRRIAARQIALRCPSLDIVINDYKFKAALKSEDALARRSLLPPFPLLCFLVCEYYPGGNSMTANLLSRVAMKLCKLNKPSTTDRALQLHTQLSGLAVLDVAVQSLV